MSSDLIGDIYAQITNADPVIRQMEDLIQYSQRPDFFHLAAAKNARIASLRQHFAKETVKAIYLSANIESIGFRHHSLPVDVLDKDFFSMGLSGSIDDKIQRIESAIVFINNNDVASNGSLNGYAEIFRRSKSTIFVAWDWDNHHWLSMSTFLAAHCDVYGPSHYDNLFILSRYNWLTVGPVCCASVQWSRDYLTRHLRALTSVMRSDEPLGRHIRYEKFLFRNQVITTVNKTFNTVALTDHSYHKRATDDRFNEWISHKTHWVVPVLNDIPIRVFDALICGGIPVVPASIRFLPVIANIPPDDVEYYGATDILNPQAVIARANRKFDQDGSSGVLRRHFYALQYHHGSSRINELLGYVASVFDIPYIENGKGG